MINEVIEHGRSYIWDLEIDSYQDVFLHDFFEDTIIDFEYLNCDEMYVGLNGLRRKDKLTWQISVPVICEKQHSLKIACRDISNHCPFLIGYCISEKPYYDSEVTILIDEDMSIYDAFHYAIAKRDLILDYVGSIETKKLSKIVKSRVVDNLPVYSRAMKKVELELSNFTTDEVLNAKKILDITSRVKSIDSIQEKTYRKNICQFDIFDRFEDIAGVRCTCEFLSDVYDVLEYIKQNPLLNIQSVDNKIESPTVEGYRGIHIIATTDVYYRGMVHENIKVEIQLRTAFQNAWSMKTHQLTYKREYIPSDISNAMRQMSNALKEADDVAQKIKESLQ